MLEALSQLDLARLQKPLALVLTADEEVGCVGAKHLAAKSAMRSRFMIIGEPTGLRPVRAGKGYALAEITVKGKEAHSAFPAHGHSAIVDAARVVLQLEHVAAKLAEFTDPTFDPPFTTMNVGLIQGGTAKNIVPGECRITVEWRPVPGQNPAFAADLIEEQLSQLATANPGFEAGFDVKRMDPPFEPAPHQRSRWSVGVSLRPAFDDGLLRLGSRSLPAGDIGNHRLWPGRHDRRS